MSNLGWYQKMTSVAKKVGGPKNLFGIVLAVGATVGIVVENAVRKGVKAISNNYNDKNIQQQNEIKYRTFTIVSDGTDKQGLRFYAGEIIRVLESDGDSILIEKVDDINNPYFVSADFLRSISDFKK